MGRESCNDRERVPRRTEDDDAKSATLTTEQTDVARERERGGSGETDRLAARRLAAAGGLDAAGIHRAGRAREGEDSEEGRGLSD